MASSKQTPSQTDATDEVLELINDHQEKAARLPPVEEVKTILVHTIRGMLSTFSKKHEGYPSGSMVDFACDANGFPILALSNLAIHTKDLVANPKCSLLVAKDPDDRTDIIITLHGDAIAVHETEIDDVRTSYLAKHPDAFWDLVANPKCSLLVAKDPDDRTDIIITLHGDAIAVHETEIDDVRTSYLAKHPDAFWDLVANPKCSLLVAKDPDDRTDIIITLHGDAIAVHETEIDDVRTSYLAKHPDAFWVDFGDFQFFRIEPKVVSFVSGVATALLRSGEFTNKEYKEAKVDQIYQFSKPISSHMNKDHGNDTKLIVQHSTSVPVDFAYMLDVDSLGFNVKAGYQDSNFKLRVPFPRPAEERKDVKTLIIEMLQAAKSRVI